MVRDDLIEVVMDSRPLDHPDRAVAEIRVDALLDALASRVPSVCPSGYDWTAGDIEDWLRSVKEGRA